MDSIDEIALQTFLESAKIERASDAGYGRGLRYLVPARRLIEVHLVEEDFPKHVMEILRITLRSADSWWVIPRYGVLAVQRIAGTPFDSAAVRVGPVERDDLCARLANNGSPDVSGSSDVYLIGGGGSPLVTWDHHWDEGVPIEFPDVDSASRLLSALNDLGTELEVFFSAG